MAKIYKHKAHGFQVKYTIYFPDGTRKFKYRYTQTRADAEQMLVSVRYMENGSRAGNLNPREISQARNDSYLSQQEAQLLSGGKSFERYDLDRVFENYRVASEIANTPYSHKCNMDRARFLAKWLLNNPLQELTAADVRSYVHQRKTGTLVNPNSFNKHTVFGVSSKTINIELCILRDIIEQAIGLKMVDKNVAREVTVPQKNSKIRRTMKYGEISRLMESATLNHHLCRGFAYEVIMFALYTGMRRSELRSLCWSDIDIETRKIAVQAKEISSGEVFTTKSGVADTVSIPDNLMPIIAAMNREGRFVFGGDTPISKVTLSGGVKKIMALAGLPEDLSLHNLRHTFGSWLLKQTGDLSYVQGAMRHLDIATTKKYIHTVEDTIDPARTFSYDQ